MFQIKSFLIPNWRWKYHRGY